MYSDLPSVYYLANAGIYVTDHHSGILIDGLFEHYDGFDSLPKSIETAIMEKQPPFERLTTLIFTHTHIDHYSPGKVSAFLQRSPQTGCILPVFSSSAELEHHFTSAVLIQIPSRHLLDKGIIVPHTALILKYAGQIFFFSGDSDPVYLNRNIPQNILSACCGQVSMAFVNPFFFSLTSRHRYIS